VVVRIHPAAANYFLKGMGMSIQKITIEEVNTIMDDMRDDEKTVEFNVDKETGDAVLDMGPFLVNFANALYRQQKIDEKNEKIKLLIEEVAWAENGYRTK
jgi:hypothetical protein